MSNPKAFVGAIHWSALQAAVDYGVIDDSETWASGPNNATVPIEYSDNSQSIRQKLADKIRLQSEDESIVVIFFDSPGRY